LGIQYFDKLKYGVIRIWIWNKHECDSGVEAMVTLRNRYCEHFVLCSNEWGYLSKQIFKNLDS